MALGTQLVVFGGVGNPDAGSVPALPDLPPRPMSWSDSEAQEGGHPTLTPQWGVIMPRFPGQPFMPARTDYRYRIAHPVPPTDLFGLLTQHCVPPSPPTSPTSPSSSRQQNPAKINLGRFSTIRNPLPIPHFPAPPPPLVASFCAK